MDFVILSYNRVKIEENEKTDKYETLVKNLKKNKKKTKKKNNGTWGWRS